MALDNLREAAQAQAEAPASDGVAPEMTTPAPGATSSIPMARETVLPLKEAVAVITQPRRWFASLGREQVLAAVFACMSIGSLFLVWYLGTKYRIDFYIRFKNVPTPYEVLLQLGEVGQSSKFTTNIVVSIKRIFYGFAVAIAIGVPLGMFIGKYRRISQLVMPAIEVLRPIPAIAWVPMSIMLWPNNEASIVFITFIGAFFPILLNTVQGVHAMDGVLMRAGQCLGANEGQLLWHVVLPGALPNIFTGLAVGMGVAWVSLIAAEMISGQFGVGYYTWEAYSLVNYPAIVLGMITIGVLGLLCSGAIRMVGRVSMPWLAYGSKK